MPEPLEITLTLGEKQHQIHVKPGDTDAIADAKARVGFMLDLFAGTGDAKKNTQARSAAVPQKKDVPSVPAGDRSAGGAK